MNNEKLLSKLVGRLQQAYGRDLRSVILYGSAAGVDFHRRHSDLNILCVLRDLSVANLEKAEPAANWWRRMGHPAPLLLAEAELERSTDAFPIEFLDLREQHRILHGEDLVAGIRVDSECHRVQLEHELRAKLLALRQRYLGIYRDRGAVLKLMLDSLPSFAALFRHALILASPPAPLKKREVLEAAGRCFGFDPTAFLGLLQVREGARRRSQFDVRSGFQDYYTGITRVCEQVDRLVERNQNPKAETR